MSGEITIRLEEEMPYITSSQDEIAAFYILFGISPDEWKKVTQGQKEIILAIYEKPSRLPEKEKFKIVYDDGKTRSEAPLLPVAFGDPDFVSTRNTIRKHEIFPRLDKIKGVKNESNDTPEVIQKSTK